MARRTALPLIGAGDRSLTSLLSTLGPAHLPHEVTGPVAARVAEALAAHTAHVESNFLTAAVLDAARDTAISVFERQELPPAFVAIVAAVEALRLDLIRASQRDLLESAEIQLLHYREGGSYRRHLEQMEGVNVGPNGGRGARRSISMVLFLTPDDWTAADGGALRIHAHRGGGAFDVAPAAGTLVVFDSATVPHEVLKTSRARTVLAIWLQEAL